LTPRVSVVIPTRNRERLLPVAVRSVLDQTHSDLELLVVDDASEDGTADVVTGFSDARLRYVRREARRGGAAARNAGIEASRGDFVAFLDDDDEWLPEKLERQLSLFRADPELGIVYSSYLVVDRESGQVLFRKTAECRGDLSRDLLVRNVLGNTSSVVVRRSCFEKAGLFDEQLPSFEDYDLWLRLAPHFRFDFVERELMKYYVHGRRISTNLEALDRGIDLMRRKHGASSALRRNLARQSMGLGVQYCSQGETGKGRRALTRAIRLAPSEPRPYLYLTTSLLGARGFRAAQSARRRFAAPAPLDGGFGLSGPSNGRGGPAAGRSKPIKGSRAS
jgi:glycosyltransferase involved in cell wall biosynthesis